jgi:hypothetical protein
MTFDIYHDLEISVKNEYSYYNEDGDIAERTEAITETMDGGKFVSFIARCLQDRDFSSISITDEKIIIAMFCPMDGTGQKLEITIKELQNG